MKPVRGWVGVRVGASLAMGLALLGCASPQSKGSQAANEREAAQTPEQIEALFSREKELPAAREGKAPDGAWTAQFPSDSEVVVTAAESHSQAEFSLGTETKTTCIFYKEAIDAGQAIAIVLDGLSKKAKLEKISVYQVSSAQGIPVAFLEGRYVVQGSEGKQAGGLKLAISPRLKTPVLCFLDEPGYAGAFASAVTGMLTSLTLKEPQGEPTYAEVGVNSIAGVPFGYQWIQMFDEGQGKRTTITLSAGFIPAGPGELATMDEVEIQKSDASGLLEGTYTQVEGGEVAHELALSRSGKSKYKVTGQVQGKDYKSEFTAPKLPDDIASYRLIQKNHQKTTKLTETEYSPSLDPSAPVKVSYAIDSKASSVTIQMGELSLLGALTEDGLVNQVTATMSGHEIKLEVIHRAGKF